MAFEIDPSLFPVLTYDDFIWYLNNNTMDQPCNSCGTNKWLVSTADGVRVNLVLQPYTTRPGISLMSAPIICRKCGLVRQYTYENVDDWLKDNPRKEGNGNG